MEIMGKTLDINIYEDIFITFFFFRCACQNMEEVSEEEYVRGLKAFGFESLEQLKENIVYVREVLLNLASTTFKEFYQFLFKFNMIKKSKTITIEVVEVYFKELFGLQFSIVTDFLSFIINHKKLACLTKDQWDCFLDFLLNQGSTFPSNYNCDEYYPLLFDEFYHWYLKKKEQNDYQHLMRNNKD